MDWLVEAAKQVPALAVLVGLVVYFLKHIATESQKSEERLKLVNDEKDATIKSLQETLTSNNTVLGSIAVLFTLVEKDMKDAAKRRS